MKKWLRVCLQTVCHQFCFTRCSEVIVSFCEVIPTNTKTLVCSTSVSVMKACFSSRQSSSDLACFVRFEKVNVYTASNYREKFKAPTSFCFVLKVSHSLWTVSCLQGCTHFFFLLVWCAKVTEGWICWWTQQFPCVKVKIHPGMQTSLCLSGYRIKNRVWNPCRVQKKKEKITIEGVSFTSKLRHH